MAKSPKWRKSTRRPGFVKVRATGTAPFHWAKKASNTGPGRDKHMEQMTTAEATVEALIAHGLDTVYALPGVHNDHLFDALFKAKDRIRTVHTRHEQGAGLHGARRRARDRQAAGLCRGAGSGAAQLRDRATHRARHQRTGAGTGRADRPRRHRPWLRPSARDPRSGRPHFPHCRPHRAHRRPVGGCACGRRRVPRDALRPAGAGGARMRDGHLGQERAALAAPAAVAHRRTADRRPRDRRGRRHPRRRTARR